VRIWIDTDIGSDVDDAVTLAYVIAHPGFELVGVSTVFGDVELRSRIAERLLEIAGIDVPVVTGLGVPITERRAGIMFGHEGRRLLDDPEPVLRSETETGGPERTAALGEAIATARPEVVLAIGPLTNIGALIDHGFDLPRLAVMGGKLTDVMLPGMVPHISEWNWWNDPVAVQKAIEHTWPTPPLVVPIEVTITTQLFDGDVDLLAGGSPLNRAVADLCLEWLDFQGSVFGAENPRVALHDPLTAALLVKPGLCPVEPRSIAVDDSAVTTVGDGSPNVDAAIDVDATALRDHLMDTLLGR
jgi:purine nucleosidase